MSTALFTMICAVGCAPAASIAQSLETVPPSIEDEMRRLGQDCADRLVRVDFETLWYCGTLNDGSVDAIQAAWSPHTQSLIISSEGGMPLPAIRLLRFLEERGAILRVRLVCMSGCAHFLFLPATRVVVEEGAVVAFHHTSTQNLVTFGDRVDPAQAAILEAQSRGERALYDELGIDPRALLWPGMSTNVLCVGPVSGNAGEWDVVTQVGWTILSRAAAEALRGHPFEGWWPSSRDEVRASLARIGGAQLTFVSNISMPEWGSFEDMVAYLRRKPTCNTETGNPF